MLPNFADLRRGAQRRLPRFAFDYVDGAAEDERCLQRNLAEHERLHLLPTTLRDTQRIDTSLDAFGERWAAPVGLTGLVRPQGDVLLARAAARAGPPHVLSTASNARLEDVRQSGAAQWFQLCVMSERAIAEQMVRRARAAGYAALVLTVDVPVSGLRERDLRNGFRMPWRPGPATVLDAALHPRWLAGVARHGMPGAVNLTEHGESASVEAQAAILARAMDRSLGWETLAWLRQLWDGPLVLKGVLHPGDARRALEHGVDGLIVSNHGGRQLDAAPATISALPGVLDAVHGRIPVFVDSGFRRGSDVVKALALGARAVFFGRTPIFGLACGGEDGAHAALMALRDELERTLALLGAASLAAVERGHVLQGSV